MTTTSEVATQDATAEVERFRVEGKNAQAGLALLVFGLTSFVLFGVPVVGDLAHQFIGFGADPLSNAWCMAWWPHAIGAGSSPLVSHELYAPGGFNLTHTNCLPLPSVIMTPVTETLGPVVSYNILTLAAPALAAWTTFLLCRHITSRFWPSLVAGYIFGFSTYVLAHLTGHLNLILVFLVPVCVHLVLLRVEGGISSRRFVVVLSVVLVSQFLISMEVFVTLALVGFATLLTAMVLMPELRKPLWITLLQVVLALEVAAIVLAPFLVSYFRADEVSPVWANFPFVYTADLLNFVVPTPITGLGRGAFAPVTQQFTGNISEQSAYLGIPLLVIVVAYVARTWSSRVTTLMVVVLVGTSVAALGPALHIAGQATVTMPWRAMVEIPILRYAVPGRFTMYMFLVVAIMVALWLSSSVRGLWRWGLVALAVVTIAPSMYPSHYRSPATVPAFFEQGLYRSHIERDATVLVIPYGPDSLLWQAEAGFSFRMAGGTLSLRDPKTFGHWPILDVLREGDPKPGDWVELAAFLRAKGVDYVVIREDVLPEWQPVLEGLGATGTSVADVDVFRVPDTIKETP